MTGLDLWNLEQKFWKRHRDLIKKSKVEKKMKSEIKGASAAFREAAIMTQKNRLTFKLRKSIYERKKKRKRQMPIIENTLPGFENLKKV